MQAVLMVVLMAEQNELVRVEFASGMVKDEGAGLGISMTGLGAVWDMVETCCELDMKVGGRHPQRYMQGVGHLAAHQLRSPEPMDEEMFAEEVFAEVYQNRHFLGIEWVGKNRQQ